MRKKMRRKGFTLMEVLVAVVIMGLVVAGGFRLTLLSLRILSETRAERELLDRAAALHLDFLTRKDMPDRGEKDGVTWTVTTNSVPVAGDLELTFRTLVVEHGGRGLTVYLP